MFKKVYYIFLFLLLFQFVAEAQICILNDYRILDNTKVTIPVIFSGALNNSLNTNGPCSIDLSFSHSTVGDLVISLVSPGGDRVTLIGPGVENSANTSLTRWDVEFVRCSNASSPYPTFNDTWDNLQSWGIFPGIYDGSYYPNDNCLEDFNTGPINGTWLLEIEDVSGRNTGVIDSLCIQFCQDDGIVLEECDPKVARFNRSSSQICLGKSYDFDAIRTYAQGMPDASEYTESYAVFSNNIIVDKGTNINVSTYNEGVYTICPITFRSTHEVRVPDVGALMNKDSFQIALLENQVCGAVSSICHTMRIITSLDTFDVNASVCKGESFSFNGKTYSTTGSYLDVKPFETCDSIYRINLEIIDFETSIESDFSNISCAVGQIWLHLNSNERSSLTTILWSTTDGNIVNQSFQDSILINRAGTYEVYIEGRGCQDIASFTVDDAFIEPFIMFNGDTHITCANDTSIIIVSSNLDVANVVWTSDSAFVVSNNELMATRSGTYFALMTSSEGCTAMDSIVLTIDQEQPSLIISSIDISCNTVATPLSVENSGLYDSFIWLKDGMGYSNIENPNADGPGLYQLTVTNVSNGCSDVAQTTVIRDDYTVLLDVVDLEINCRTPIPKLTATTNRIISDYNWIGPSGFSSTQARPGVSEVGTYTLNVIDQNGCVGDTFLVVGMDTISPVISSFDDTKTCVLTSRVLTLPLVDPSYNYNWTGPFAFQSSLAEPTVSDTGVYHLVVTAANGCKDSKDFEVFKGPDLPGVTFMVDTLACNVDTVQIIPSDIVNYSLDWQSDELIFNLDSSIVKIDTGTTIWVNVIENASGCSNRSEIKVSDIRDFPEIEIFKNDIDCNVSLAQITLISTPSFAGISWSGPQGFSANSMSVIDVSVAGTYYAQVTSNLGCVIVDSVIIDEKMDSPVLDVADVVIYCDPDSAILAPNSVLGLSSFSWIYQGMEVGTSSNLVVREGGTYTLKVIGDNGCPNTGNIEVTVDTLANPVILQKSSDLECLVSVTPLVFFETMDSILSTDWSGSRIEQISSDSIQVTLAGIYGVTTLDDRNCTSYSEIEIEDKTDFIEVNPFFKEIGCNQPGLISLSFDTDPGNNIKWIDPLGNTFADGQREIDANVAGNYTYIVESGLGCESIDSVQMTIDTLSPTILNKVEGEISCNIPMLDIGFAIDRSISSVVWTNAKDTITEVSTLSVVNGGVYIAQITANNNCVLIDSLVILEDTDVPIVTAIVDTLTCLVSRVDLEFDIIGNLDFVDVFGPGNYRRRGRFTNTFAYDTGRYEYVVTALNGCSFSDSIIIEGDLEAPMIEIADTILLPCDGSPAVLGFQTMDSIINYRWIGESFASTDPNPEILDTIEVSLFVLGDNGCPLLDTLQILEDNRQSPVFINKRNVYCDPDVGRLIAQDTQGIVGFEWTSPSGVIILEDTIITQEIGIYTLVVDIGNTCFDTLQGNLINDNAIPGVNVLLNEPFQCKNTEVFLDLDISHVPITRLKYVWSTIDGNIISVNDANSAYVEGAGMYKIVVIDTISSCQDSITYNLIKEQQSLADFDFTFQSPLCIGDRTGEVLVGDITGGFGPYKYQLSGIGVQDETEFLQLPSGDYQVKVIDSIGCELSKVFELDLGFNLELELMPDTTVRLGDSLEFSYSTNIPNNEIRGIEWFTGNQLLCDDCLTFADYPIQNTKYRLVVSNDLGCVASDDVDVFILQTIDWAIPNIFSPNGDNQNDLFFPVENVSVESIVSLSIFDAWGGVVFRVENAIPGDMSLAWDGKVAGRDVATGVYVVIIEALLKDNKTKTFARDLTVVR